MPAIQTIIETYIRFADEEALLALRAHRLKLLATSSEGDPFFKSLRSQCIEEISAIEAGLARLRAAAAPSPGGRTTSPCRIMWLMTPGVQGCQDLRSLVPSGPKQPIPS